MLCTSCCSCIDPNCTIAIHIFTPCWGIKKIKIKLAFPIKCLDTIYQSTNFLYKGSLLCKDLPFYYYGVKEGDCLITVSSNTPESEISAKLLALSNDISFTSIANLSTARESTRMNDIKLMNVEMNPVKYHIAIKNMERKLRSEKMQPTPDLIIPEKSKSVSSQPLPMFWNANPCKKSSVMRSDSCIQVETGDIDNSQRLY